MPSAFFCVHPWFGEVAITWRRRGAPLPGRIGIAAALVIAIAGLILGVAGAAGVSPPTVGTLALSTLVQWPLQAALLIAVGSHALVHARLLTLADTLHDGWWAAMPVDPRSRAHAQWLVTAGVAAVLLAAGLLLVGLIALLAAASDFPGAAVAVVASGVIAGSASGLAVARRRRRGGARSSTRVGVRQPLFPTAWLDDPHLPHVSDWQRREVLLRWRCGGCSAPMGAALLLIPGGSSLLAMAGMVVFVMSAAWFGVALRGSLMSTMAAAALLRSTPVTTRSLARAAWHYPAFAGAIASGCALSVPLATGAWALLPVWGVAVALPLLPLLPRLGRQSFDRIQTGRRTR